MSVGDATLAGWQRRAPTVRASVACGAERHEVVWRRGSLTTAHHDLAAEEALEALGGDAVPCLAVVRAWREARVAGAPTPWVWFSAAEGRSRLTANVRSQGDAALPEVLRRTRLLTLSLGRSLSRDAFGEVAARAQPALASTAPRGVELAVTGGPGGPRLARHRGRPLLVLPVRWLTHVWARGLETEGDELVVDAARAPGPDGLLAAQVLVLSSRRAHLEPRRLSPRS